MDVSQTDGHVRKHTFPNFAHEKSLYNPLERRSDCTLKQDVKEQMGSTPQVIPEHTSFSVIQDTIDPCDFSSSTS
jgi:hypothetical protein